jgi:hypothetical protein
VNAASWEWDFGDGAAPATASTQGPHTVYYTTSGSKTVSLTINGSVTETKPDFIDVSVTPIAGFSFTSYGLAVDFTNLSANATTYLWEFGDGATSSENNPSHTYATGGSYDVTLHASFQDCDDYETLQVIIPLVDVRQTGMIDEISIFPNPARDCFKVDRGNLSPIKKIGIFAASGKFIYPENDLLENNSIITVDVSGLEAGIYFLTLETESEIIVKKIVIR